MQLIIGGALMFLGYLLLVWAILELLHRRCVANNKRVLSVLQTRHMLPNEGGSVRPREKSTSGRVSAVQQR